MTKGNLIATSFVGAIPAGALAFFSIKAFIDFTEKMPTALQAVNGVTVLVSVLMALSPIAILIFMRGPAKEGEAAAGAAAVGAATAAVPTAAGSSEAIESVEFASESAAEFEAVGGGSTDEDEDMSLSGFEELPDSTSAGSDDAFEFDDSGFEFEDEDLK